MNKTNNKKLVSKQNFGLKPKDEINVENPVEKARRQIASQETTGVIQNTE